MTRNPGEHVARILVFFVIFVGLGLTTWQIATRSSTAYERMLVQRVSNGLEVLGYDWARISADGLKLELRGHASDTFARELALESARANAPFATITSYATATLAPPETRDPVRVELLRDSRGVTLTGQTASRGMRDRLNARLKAQAPDLPVRDLTGIQAATPPRGWGNEIEVAALAAAALANAYVVMEPGQVLVDGQAETAQERARLIAAMRGAAGERVVLSLSIRIPTEVIAPFAFAAEKRPGEKILVESCAVRDESEDAIVRSALDPNSRERQFSVCQVGLGGPTGDWTGTIAAAIAALRELPAGRVEIEYHDVRLIGTPPTLDQDLAPVATSLAAALPEGFSLTTEVQADDAATRAAIARDLYWMQFDRSADGISITGKVPTSDSAAAIRAYAIALFGAEVVTETLRVVEAPAPRQWQVAALAMIDQLALGALDVRMGGYRITVRGVLPDPALARLMHDEMVQGLPGYEITTLFEVDLPAQVAAIPLPGPRCAARLGQVHANRSIEFSTGSARITEDSSPILDALAEVFERCTDDVIEIGGHTDSQGPEDLNERISQARAESVASALIERGVSPAHLAPRGYGEARPLASNETEAGRALNRRIEFLPATLEAPAKAESGGDTASD